MVTGNAGQIIELGLNLDERVTTSLEALSVNPLPGIEELCDEIASHTPPSANLDLLERLTAT